MAVNKMDLNAAANKSRIKKPFPWVFKLFFVVATVLIAGAVLRYFEDKHIIDQIQVRANDKERMQEALGWGSELKIEKKSDPLAKVRFMLRDKNHEPIKGAVVKITLLQAVDQNNVLSQNAITLPLIMVEPGVYRGQINLPFPGDWDASISAQIGPSTYQVTERITLP